MRILFLSHRLPFPPDKGDKIRSYNILQYLVERHEVSVVSLIDDARDLEHVSAMTAKVHELLVERIGPPMSWVRTARACLTLAPLTPGHFYSPGLQRKLDELIERADFDVFFCFSSPMAEYLFRSRHWGSKIRRAMRLMDLIDVDSYKWRQYAERSRGIRNWIYRYEAWQLAGYEARIARSFDNVLVVSEQEKRYFPRANTSNVHAMSNGVDLTYFSPDYSGPVLETPAHLVFTGVMDYWPNVDGVTWFAREVFPQVRAVEPDVQLYIVGTRPARKVLQLAEIPGVHVTGFVTDVRRYVAGAAACIVPLRVARGVQNKALEAMAMGKAVIATPQAFEGLDARPGTDLLVADGADAFARATLDLLRDPPQRKAIGTSARSVVERHYSWPRNLRLLDALIAAGAIPPLKVAEQTGI